MSAKKNAGKREKSSPNYPVLARRVVEASQDDGSCKLPQALYIVATPIGNLGDISLRALRTLAHVDAIACEDTRVSGKLLTQYGIKKPLIPYHDYNAEKARPGILKKIATGAAIALISDAGMPLIADPGYKLSQACRAEGYDVVVIPGANAALAGLAASGLPPTPFYFTGFLPPKTAARRTAVEALALLSSTLVFYEAPQRLAETLADLEDILGASRPAAVTRELTKLFEETRASTLGELAAYYRENAVKGEIVILVGPAEKKTIRAEGGSLDDLLKENLRTQSLRDAVTSVCALTGAKKSEVYARALWLRGKGTR